MNARPCTCDMAKSGTSQRMAANLLAEYFGFRMVFVDRESDASARGRCAGVECGWVRLERRALTGTQHRFRGQRGAVGVDFVLSRH